MVLSFAHAFSKKMINLLFYKSKSPNKLLKRTLRDKAAQRRLACRWATQPRGCDSTNDKLKIRSISDENYN